MSVATLSNITLAVQRQTATRDAMGGQTKSWASLVKVQGRVNPLSSSEMIRHSQDDDRITHKVYVAGTPDIRPLDRLSHAKLRAGRHLYVKGVREPSLSGNFITIECEERDDYD
jgi:SPP1 family predicted phage head-tail adaptor